MELAAEVALRPLRPSVGIGCDLLTGIGVPTPPIECPAMTQPWPWARFERPGPPPCGLSCEPSIHRLPMPSHCLGASQGFVFSLVRRPIQPPSAGLTRGRAKGFVGVVEISAPCRDIGTVSTRSPLIYSDADWQFWVGLSCRPQIALSTPVGLGAIFGIAHETFQTPRKA